MNSPDSRPDSRPPASDDSDQPRPADAGPADHSRPAGRARFFPAWLVSLLLAIVFLGFFAMVARAIIQNKPEAKPAQRREPVFSVRAVAVAPETRAPSVFLIGETEARDYAVLTSPLDSEALAVPVREGDPVTRGDRLALLDLRDQDLDLQERDLQGRLQQADLRDIQVQAAALSVNLQTNLEDIRVQLQALRADRQSDNTRLADMNRLLKISENDLARARSLSASGVVPKTQVEENERALLSRRLERQAVRARVEKYDSDERLLKVRERGLREIFDSETKRLQVRESQVRAQLEQTELALERARVAYERAQVRAPFSGKIARVHASAGSRVARGAPLVELFDPDSVRLRASVPNQYLPNLREGGRTRARLKVNGETVTLATFRIAPLTEPGRGSADVYFELPRREWVLGATHEFAMDLPPAENAVALPFDALYSDSRIYKIDADSRARGLDCKRVGVARESGGALALMECPGLRPGDMVVATRLPNLVEGAKVLVAGEIQNDPSASPDRSGSESKNQTKNESETQTESESESESDFDSGSESESESDSEKRNSQKSDSDSGSDSDGS